MPEIEQKAYLEFGGAEVMDQLGFVAGIQHPSSFQFHNYTAINDEIRTEVTYQLASKPDWNGQLVFNR